jgi:hypothetical protein
MHQYLMHNVLFFVVWQLAARKMPLVAGCLGAAVDCAAGRTALTPKPERSTWHKIPSHSPPDPVPQYWRLATFFRSAAHTATKQNAMCYTGIPGGWQHACSVGHSRHRCSSARWSVRRSSRIAHAAAAAAEQMVLESKHLGAIS